MRGLNPVQVAIQVLACGVAVDVLHNKRQRQARGLLLKGGAHAPAQRQARQAARGLVLAQVAVHAVGGGLHGQFAQRDQVGG